MCACLQACAQQNPLQPEASPVSAISQRSGTGRAPARKQLIEYAGRVCYRSTHRMGTSPEFIAARVREGHEDIIEHVVVTLRFSGDDAPLRWRMLNRHCEVTELGQGQWLVSGNTRVWLSLFRAGAGLEALPILYRIAPKVFDEYAETLQSQTLPGIDLPAPAPVQADALLPVQDGAMRVTLLGFTQPLPDDPKLSLDHGSATFLFEGISRACTHQLVRHRLASFSQESQRYVALERGEWQPIVPDTVAANPEAMAELENFWRMAEEKYARLHAAWACERTRASSCPTQPGAHRHHHEFRCLEPFPVAACSRQGGAVGDPQNGPARPGHAARHCAPGICRALESLHGKVCHAMSMYSRSHLLQLESEAIFVLREVAAQFERPVLLFSGGKDSIVLSHLARRAFWPGKIPFPLMHIDTGHNFEETLDFRDQLVEQLDAHLIVRYVQDSIDQGRVVEETGPNASRNTLQTVTLLDAIAEFKFAYLSARCLRHREGFSEKLARTRHAVEIGTPKANAARVVENLMGASTSCATFPRLPAQQLDRDGHLAVSPCAKVEIPVLYYSHRRDVVRDGVTSPPRPPSA